uniref:Uncharacterized protein n=1 Tax=Meloidogyne enterolobii TaxID=390850 RepID=A0A6V7U9I8_MELEN|nr:unnamed protein product [Meloidogyne enterolobii]
MKSVQKIPLYINNRGKEYPCSPDLKRAAQEASTKKSKNYYQNYLGYLC